MQHERHVARRALPRPPARPAGQEVRPAAAVEQHDRLARGARAPRGCAGAAPAAPRACRRSRTGGSAWPSTRARQPQTRQRVDALRPRRRAAGDEHRAGRPRAPHRRRAARRSAGRPRACRTASCSSSTTIRPTFDERREHGRARADADARLAAAQPRPLVVALAVGELRVQDGDGVAEALHEPRDDLRRQRDLGHEHDHVAARRRASRPPRAGRPRSCPSRSRRAAAAAPPARPRGSRAARPPARPSAAGRAPPRADRDVHGRAADDRAARSRRSPRASSRRSAAVSGPVNRGSDASSARWRVGAAARPPRPAARARRVQRRLRPRALRRQQQRQRPRRGRGVLARHPQREVHEVRPAASASSTRRGATTSCSDVSASPVTTPTHVAVAEGHDEHRPDPDAVRALVVERPAQRAGRRERLDLGDGRRHRPFDDSVGRRWTCIPARRSSSRATRPGGACSASTSTASARP